MVTGSFEVLNPSNGTTMGWHQDGYGPGMMIAHNEVRSPCDSYWHVWEHFAGRNPRAVPDLRLVDAFATTAPASSALNWVHLQSSERNPVYLPTPIAVCRCGHWRLGLL